MSQFGQPGIGGDKFTAAEHNGCLLLFFPDRFQADVKTVNGDCDAVTTKVVNLDTGATLSDTMIFGSALVPQLKGAVADKGMVLGRLGQGQAKGGNNPPWILSPHTEADVAKAEAYLAANPRNQFQNAAPAVAAPPTPAAYAPQATAGPVAPVAAPAAGGADPRVAGLAVKLVAAGAPVQPGMTYDQLVAIAGLVGVAV